ncbi:MAG: riboflavin biosynthesis protein RibF [Clostridia bacterium]|nr:riboflavin biosynthesis protein RibF [Clostridia bacterium]
MLILNYGKETYPSPCAFVLGCFDGIHLGHDTLVQKAAETGLPVGLMLLKGKGEKALYTMEERLLIAEKIGVDFCLVVELNEETKRTRWDRFLETILNRIPVDTFFCGEDFRFGDRAEGTPALISTLKRVVAVPLLERNGRKISSSEVRRLVSEGNIRRANELLAYPFFVLGQVRHGRQVGRTYGFPTANILYPAEKTPLGFGVYAVRVGDKVGIANYGGRPTFGEENPLLEVYIDDFEGDLYGKQIEVVFTEKIREIRSFSSKEELSEQLRKDIQKVRV